MNEYIKKSLKIGGLLALCGGLFASGLAGGYALGKTNNKEADKQIKNDSPKMRINEGEISDLTGLTINFNDSLNLNISGYFDLYYTSNNQSFEIIRPADYSGVLEYYVDEDYSLYAYENNTWNNTAYKTIVVSGGSDSTNSTLINWVVANSDLGGGDSSEDTSDESTESAEYLYKIDFNDNINKYAPFGVYSDYFIINNNTGYYTIFEGLFEDSFENQYKRITITYAQGNGTSYGESASVLKTMPQNSLMFMYISYIDINDKEIVACYPVYKNREGGTFYTPETTWRSSAFQHLTILEDNTTYESTVFSSFTNSRTALSSFNSGGTGVSVYTASSGVFTLLGSAFSAVASLMAIQVLPNITLGLLFFLPLIAGIIIAIIWIVKR